MTRFDHEKLDVYRISIDFVAWTHRFIDEVAEGSSGRHGSIRGQLERASQSIPLNIAEGNGKRAGRERRRFFEIARGSAMECAASLDVCVAVGACPTQRVAPGKELCHRLVSMLTKLAPPPRRSENANENEERERGNE